MSEAAEKYLTKRNRYFSDKRELRERVEDLNDFHCEQSEEKDKEIKDLRELLIECKDMNETLILAFIGLIKEQLTSLNEKIEQKLKQDA